jgi:hypothetical protein
MKKYVSIFFSLALIMSMMTGCGRSSTNDVKPNDSDMNRPGVNESVVDRNNGMVDESGVADPATTNHPITDEIENGVENAGNAMQRGIDRMGNSMKNAADDMKSR